MSGQTQRTEVTAQTRRPKLEALTSLRFVAAAMIVFTHCSTKFGGPSDPTFGGRFLSYTGVSFFFVLSGFILTYVYPRLDSWSARGHFLLARFARVWPCHVFAFAVLLLALHTTPLDLYHQGKGIPCLANLFMVHSWVPVRQFYLSGNSPSWSISTELAFYFLFPLLIWRFERTWLLKLLGCVLLAAALIAVGHLWHLPYEAEQGVTTNGLLYINPLSRLLEFCLGMCMALLWRKCSTAIRIGRKAGTLLEIAAFALAAVNMYYTTTLIEGFKHASRLSPAVFIWFTHGLLCCSYAAVIFVAALEKGWITRLLSMRVLVVLGEISFSVYLLHTTIMYYLHTHAHIYEGYGKLADSLIFFTILLTLSYLSWALVETPARKLLLGLWPKPAAPSRVGVVADPAPQEAGRTIRKAG